MATEFTEQPLETRSEPPTPSLKPILRSNRRATSLDLNLQQPASTTTTEPIFCCQDCTKSIKETSFCKFVQVGSVGPPFGGSVRSICHPVCEHVIEVKPISRNTTPNNPLKPSRYYAFLGLDNKYHEIDVILFTYLQDISVFDEATKARFTCPAHHQTGQLVRHDRPAIDQSPTSSTYFELSEDESMSQPCDSSGMTEGCGISTPPLSPYQISLEKRRFMIRKLSYGRKDQMQEIIRNAVVHDDDSDRQGSWGWSWQERRQEKEMQEMLDFEVRDLTRLNTGPVELSEIPYSTEQVISIRQV
ncbi:hypothetical protein EG329_005383 [Mollisiaceae sp. DMI_Dod_QoI]|nr:hypothetical protein EG329_005383 [Helotiales sp. DMI_Dod_QoI]